MVKPKFRRYKEGDDVGMVFNGSSEAKPDLFWWLPKTDRTEAEWRRWRINPELPMPSEELGDD